MFSFTPYSSRARLVGLGIILSLALSFHFIVRQTRMACIACAGTRRQTGGARRRRLYIGRKTGALTHSLGIALHPLLPLHPGALRLLQLLAFLELLRMLRL